MTLSALALTVTFLLLLGVCPALITPASAAEPAAKPLPFFAMDTGTRDAAHQTAEAQAGLLEQLGYDGLCYTYQGLPALKEMLAALDRHQVKLSAVYTVLPVEKDPPPDLGPLRELCDALKGRDVVLMIQIPGSKSYPQCSPDGDEVAVPMLRDLAAAAEPSGVRVALYPHVGGWVERVEHAVRVVQKVDRQNTGVVFNLCHWLKVDGQQMETRLRLALPHLFAVTVNGADADAADWSRLIQTLDRGTFDVTKLVGTLRTLGYAGPFGLQHYGVSGGVRENLQRSLEAWRQICATVAAGDTRKAP